MSKRTRYDKSMQWFCAAVFSLFSFIYIYVFQGELLALMQDYLSRGVTSSNAFLAALIITLLLMLMQWGINRMSKLHGRWEAVSYLPSCTLLALVTDVNVSTMLYTPVKWLWGVPICVLLYIFLVWANRNINDIRKKNYFGVLWPNLLTFNILFILTAQLSNNAPTSHMELAAWHYVHDDKYEEVLSIGRRSDDSNATLTSLRNLAMAKTGRLGDLMFHYPQPYGADGLIYNKYTRQTDRYGSRTFYDHLGAEAYGGESGRAFAERMYHKTDSAIYRDLYLAALLLDKDLQTFAREASPLAKADGQLPVHYQEALLLYNDQNPDTPVAFVADTTIVNHFSDYQTLQRQYADDAIIAKNLSKRKFGNTYWTYYDY